MPDSRFELIEGARTFSMIDQPNVLAELILDFEHSSQRMVNVAEPNAA